MKKDFSIKEALSFGFKVVGKNYVFFLGVLAIMNTLPGLLNLFGRTANSIVLSILLAVVSSFTLIVTAPGFTRITLRLLNEEKISLEELFPSWQLVGRYILTSFLYILICLIGFVLLIVPGIIWAIKYSAALFVVIDKDLYGMEALRESDRITAGAKGKIFSFAVAAAAINLLFLVIFSIVTTSVGNAIFGGLPATSFSLTFLSLIMNLFFLALLAPALGIAHAFIYRKLASQTIQSLEIPPMQSLTTK